MNIKNMISIDTAIEALRILATEDIISDEDIMASCIFASSILGSMDSQLDKSAHYKISQADLCEYIGIDEDSWNEAISRAEER